MTKYHKIQSVFKRDPETKYKTFLAEYSMPAFEYLADSMWIWTEKIEGMNMRAIWNEQNVSEFGLEPSFRFAGRTDRAQVPGDLLDTMMGLFSAEMVDAGVVDDEVIFYGEGFGGSIQRGKHEYGTEKRFVLFDISVNGRFLPFYDVINIGEACGLDVVDSKSGSLQDAIEFVRAGFPSKYGGQAEGLVLRPLVELYDQYGNRVIAKVKTRDFPNG